MYVSETEGFFRGIFVELTDIRMVIDWRGMENVKIARHLIDILEKGVEIQKNYNFIVFLKNVYF